MGLLRLEEVREELKITEEQYTSIREAVEAARNSLQPPDIDFASLRDASEEEQQAARAKMQEFGQSLEKEVRTKVAGILDEAQMQRLRGLWVQRAGALAALTNEEIAAELKLNDDQKATLKTQRDEQRSQMRGGGFGFGGRPRVEGNPPPAGANPPPAGDNPPAAGANPPPQGAGGGGGDFLERFREARRAADEKALAVLTDEQKTAFAAIKGDEFTFPQQEFGGGRGGFGGRGRGEGDGDGPPRRRGGPPRDAE